MKTEFRLTGGKALIGILIILGIVGAKWVMKSRALHSQAAEVIKVHLAAEYSRHMFPVIEKAAQIPGVNQREISRLTRKFSPDGIDIVSLRARGRPEDVVVRVEITVDGERPPDAKSVRHFRLHYNSAGVWSLEREVSMWSYYLSF